MALHDDRTFVRHFSWVILALVATTIIFIILSFVIVAVSGIGSHSGYSYVQYMKAHPGAVAPASAARAQAQTAPVHPGMVAKAASSGAANSVAANAKEGKTIWQAHCSACHATGAMGAPRIGDQQAWGPILAKTDIATLYQRAINGYKAMPPKGGALNLSNAQVKSAASYMILKSGGPQPSAAPVATQGAAAKAKVAANGEQVWQAHCSVCHATGVGGAPKIGDKQAWGPILAKTDLATLYKRAINGYHGPRGFMPAKGGAASLSDAEVRAAAQYMVSKSGGKPGKS